MSMINTQYECFQNSVFQKLPLELIEDNILPHLDGRDLTCVALVCRLFSQLTLRDVHWKRLFKEQGAFTKAWIGPPPLSWKQEYLCAQKVLFRCKDNISGSEKKIVIDPFEYWRAGCINSAFFETDELIEFFRAICGEPVALSVNEKETYQGLILRDLVPVLPFIQMVHARNAQQALQLYLKNRKQLIASNPCIGFWMSCLVESINKSQSAQFVLKKEEKIFPPTNPSAYAGWHYFKSFIEGMVLMWFYQNKKHEALVSLQSYLILQNRFFLNTESTDFTETHLFFKKLFETISLAAFPSSVWETIHTQILDLPPSSYKWEIAFCYYTTVGKMKQTLLSKKMLLCLVEYLIDHLSKRSDEVKEFQVACLPVLHLKKHGVEGFTLSELVDVALIVREYEIEIAYPFVLQILSNNVFTTKLPVNVLELFYYVHIDLLSGVGQYVEAIRTWKKLGEFYFIGKAEVLNDPITTMPFFDRGYCILEQDHDALHEMLATVSCDFSPATLGLAYAHYMKGNFLSADQLVWRMAPHFPKEALVLFLKYGRKQASIQLWAQMGNTDRIFTLQKDFLDIGYKLLETSKEARIWLMELKSFSGPYVSIGVAYAHYLEGKIPITEHLIAAIPLVDSEMLVWLKKAGQKEIEAAFLYALCFTEVLMIEEYFDGLLDLHPKDSFTIYFYWARRLIQLGHFTQARPPLEIALEMQPDHQEALQLQQKISSCL